MTDITHKTLFSVIQTTDADGNSFFQVDWHPDMHPLLDDMIPEGQMTGRLINLAEELISADSGF